MKKAVIAFLVVVLLATSSAMAVSARPDKPARPEKLDRVIFVHPVAPDRPARPEKPPGKPPKEEEEEEEEAKDDTYYELWGGYLADTISYHINPDVSLVTGGDPIAAVNDGVAVWDAATADKLFSYELFSYAGPTEKRWYEEDGQNTVSWVKFIPRDIYIRGEIKPVQKQRGTVESSRWTLSFKPRHRVNGFSSLSGTRSCASFLVSRRIFAHCRHHNTNPENAPKRIVPIKA